MNSFQFKLINFDKLRIGESFYFSAADDIECQKVG